MVDGDALGVYKGVDIGRAKIKEREKEKKHETVTWHKRQLKQVLWGT